jgi:membrane protein implicated in regulation of membrane protease activity
MSWAPFIWAVLGIVLTAAELFTPGFWVIFLGAGGLLTALATLLIPGLAASLPLQLLIWLGSSSLLLGVLRRLVRRRLGRLRAIADDAVGEQAIVVETITPDKPGRIRFRGTTWTARSYDEEHKPGDTVQILEREDLTYYVCRPFPEGGTD